MSCAEPAAMCGADHKRRRVKVLRCSGPSLSGLVLLSLAYSPVSRSNEIYSCYSTTSITLGLCGQNDECPANEKCDRKVCVEMHTLASTAYETGTIDTIIDKWPPLSLGNGLPLTEECFPPHNKGCFITRYVDWPPETNTHIATSENAGFRGGCSDGVHEYDSIQLLEGYHRHSADTQTVTYFCSHEADCNAKFDVGSLTDLGVYEAAGSRRMPIAHPALFIIVTVLGLSLSHALALS